MSTLKPSHGKSGKSPTHSARSTRSSPSPGAGLKSHREEQVENVLLKEKLEDLERTVSTLRHRQSQLKTAKNTMVLIHETKIKDISQSLGHVKPADHSQLPVGRRNTLLSLEIQNMDAKRVAEQEEYRKNCMKELIALKKSLPCFSDTEIKKLNSLHKKNSERETRLNGQSESGLNMAGQIENLIAELEKKDKQIAEFRPRRDSDKCDHKPFIIELEGKIQVMENGSAALLIEQQDSEEHIKKVTLERELREKEFKEKTTEDNFDKELKERWQKMYGDWMLCTENKILELQQANALLQTILTRAK